MGCALITFEVPGEPMGKGRHRSFVDKGKGAVVHVADRETDSYERTVKWIARQAMGRQGVRELLDGPLWMHVTAFMAAPKTLHKRLHAGEVIYATKKPDFDNVGKIIGDALNKVLYADDAQVVDGRVVKRFDMLPRVVVSIGRLDPKP
jgi:Holliday junction resolvase RusA-like endonuclease